MRKNTARHWLHAALDLLPVLLIPVFMIYSHRHDLTTDVPVGATATIESIDYNYKYSTNEVIYNDNVLDTSSIINGNKYLLTKNSANSTSTLKILDYGTMFQTVNFSINDYVYQSTYASSYNWSVSLRPTASSGTNFIYYPFSSTPGNNIGNQAAQIQVGSTCTVYCDSYTSIHLDTLSTYFTFSALPTNLNEIVSADVDVSATVDYGDASIDNVFIDNFNSTINTYFNMGNVFNLNGVYQWFNTNIFGGNAPTIIYSVWNIALYELVMDLLFLLYGLFMFFIDMCKRLMEKPLDSIK